MHWQPEIEDTQAEALLEALLDPEWMIRRKDSVAFGTESLLCRTHSFDFVVPEPLKSQAIQGGTLVMVPLGFWWKAPGKYTNIDFRDEAGNALPLSTSTSDEDVTLAVMEALARRVLGLSRKGFHLETLQGIANVVQQDAIKARNEVKNSWLSWRGKPAPQNQEERERWVLANDDYFAALLEVCAMASIFTVNLIGRLEERRVIKLRYDETCTGRRGTDTFKTPDSWAAKIGERFRSVALLLGLASYRIDIGNAFVRGLRYHFEEDAPPGLRLTGVSSKRASRQKPIRAKRAEPRVHLYEKNLRSDTYLTVRGYLVVTDEWLTLATVCTVVAICVLFGIVNNIATLDPTSSQSVITLAVLVPSIATSIVWRRVHWLVQRLQRWLRIAFGSLGLFLFYVALRIAESPTESIETGSIFHRQTINRLADAGEIRTIATIGIGWALLVGVLLVIAWMRSAWTNRQTLLPKES